MKPSMGALRSLSRAGVVLLLLAVVGLSPVARKNLDLPGSNPARYLSKSSKIDAAHAPVHFDRKPLHPIPEEIPANPERREPLSERAEKISSLEIGLVIALQHRSPPSLLA